jgi:hypothetical protein
MTSAGVPSAAATSPAARLDTECVTGESAHPQRRSACLTVS